MMKVLLAISLLSIGASASAAIPLEQALELCRAEQNALRRLTCYDSIVATSTAAPSPSRTIDNTAEMATIPPASTSTGQAKPETKDTDFGLEHIASAEEAVKSISAVVKTINYSPRKELIIDFDNGQRWRQIGTDYYSIKVGQQHHIKRGVLNSFLLGNDQNSRTIRVKREK